jgi:tetratricopeptide (TPR) repeat protein
MEAFFSVLTAKLQEIARAWPNAGDEKRLLLANELLELRKMSDQVVDQWLLFEESLSHVINTLKEEKMNGGKQPQPTVHSLCQGEDPAAGNADHQAGGQVVLHPHLHTYRKGEGFYHLRLYQDARKCFADLLQQSPDWEIGRLYYAYSLLFCEERGEAMKEFRLLSRSASSPKVTAISYNAIGCLLAEEAQWLEAGQAFKAALHEFPAYAEAQFNLALCCLQDGEAKEALEAVEGYLQQVHDDWEAETLWLRAAKQLGAAGNGAETIPPARLQSPAKHLDSRTLQEMASMYEAKGQIHRAQLCYVYLREQLPREGWVYQGLAWTTWLIAGTRKALPLIKKAVSLSPDNLDFHFSYGWMLLFDGLVEKAVAVFRFILHKQADHRLAQSGLVAAYERLGETDSAKAIAERFLAEADPYLKSLGYYHLGRLAVIQENWKLADQYFQQVAGEERLFREVPLYRSLCAAKLGKPAGEGKLFLDPIPT